MLNDSRVRALFNDCINVTRRTNDITDMSYVWDNQIESAKEIIYNFYTKQNRWCLLFAEMQSGKSGTFFTVPYIISKNSILRDKLAIGMSGNEINVYMFTGMNERELIQQFETDILTFTGMDIKKNILHNSEMRKFLTKKKDDWSNDDKLAIEKMKNNSLILIDESHYGSDKNQILNQFLTKILGISPNGDNKPLIDNNVYVVSISATPMAEFINANVSNFEKKIISLKNANGYYGIIEMFNDGKIFKSYDLKDSISVNKFLDKIIAYKENGYCLVRCTEKQRSNIMNEIGVRMLDFKIIDYDQYSNSRILDNMGINDILLNTPTKKTIIFLKGLLRAGKRVDTKNVLMMHDTAESKVDTTVQSLLGRCCGYNKNSNIEIYCDYESANKYKKWAESGYDIKLVPNKSKNIKGDNKISQQFYTKYIIDDYTLNPELELILSSSKKPKKDKIRVCEIVDGMLLNNIIKNTDNIKFGTFYSCDKNSNQTVWDVQFRQRHEYDFTSSDIHNLKESDLGKYTISAGYDVNTKIFVLTVGIVVENTTTVDIKSMYHQTNNLNN
jgi:hypothetical protein